MYPYQKEQKLRTDYAKGRPITLDRLDMQVLREAELVQKMSQFRSVFNPTWKRPLN